MVDPSATVARSISNALAFAKCLHGPKSTWTTGIPRRSPKRTHMAHPAYCAAALPCRFGSTADMHLPYRLVCLWANALGGRSRQTSVHLPTTRCVARRANHASRGSTALSKNIRIYRNLALPYNPAIPPATRGVSRSSRDAGRDAMAATAPARDGGCRAGDREQRQARYDTAMTASSNGLDGERTPAVENPARTCADGEVVWS